MSHSVITKRGDKGETDLFGMHGIPKDSPRLHAYGDIDELNALLGLLLTEPLPPAIQQAIEHIQHTLFRAGADLATPASVKHSKVKRIRLQDTEYLEKEIYSIESALPPQRSFILPKGSRSAALLHHTRTVCRRAERWGVSAARIETVNPDLLIYLNRLSDYFFVAARLVNIRMNIPEEQVDYA